MREGFSWFYGQKGVQVGADPGPCLQRSASGLTCAEPMSGFPLKITGSCHGLTSCSKAERARDEVSSRVRWKVAPVRGGTADEATKLTSQGDYGAT